MPTAAEIVDQLFRCRWPRLYLDTADLISIGRGHLAHDLVESLLHVTERHAVILVVSVAHMRDAMKPGDADAPHLLASALERFWMRGLVDLGPDDIEPWKNGPADIKLDPWGNVRELLTSAAAPPKLAEFSSIQDTVHAADVVMKATQQAFWDGKKSNRSSDEDVAIVVGSAKMLALRLETDIESAVDRCAAILSRTLTPSERAALIKQALPAVAMITMLSPLLDSLDPEQRVALSKLSSAGPDLAPGHWLASRLFADRYRNVQRAPSPSDSIDLEHCAHFPYVDIATCDKQAHAAIGPMIEKARGSRPARLFRNNRLEDVVQHISTLPTYEQLRDEALKQLS